MQSNGSPFFSGGWGSIFLGMATSFQRNVCRSTEGRAPRVRLTCTVVAVDAYPFPRDGYPCYRLRLTPYPRDGQPFPKGRVPPFPRDENPISEGRLSLFPGPGTTTRGRLPDCEAELPRLRGTATLSIFRETCIPLPRNGYPSSEGGVPIFRGTVVPLAGGTGTPFPTDGQPFSDGRGVEVPTVASIRVP